MIASRDLQSIVDPFVTGLGGELVSELVGNDNPAKNADYLFRRHNVIAELKSLEADGLARVYRKLVDLLTKWDRERRYVVYGRTLFDSNNLPAKCRNELVAAMEAPLQKHVVVAANNQIKSTKKLLNMPDAKGLLWVAIDGNGLQPNIVWHLLTHLLLKKKKTGDPAFSSIHGLAYFAPRVVVRIPQTTAPTIFWFSGSRKPDEELSAFLTKMNVEWFRYVSKNNQIDIQPVAGKPDDARFRDSTQERLNLEYCSAVNLS